MQTVLNFKKTEVPAVEAFLKQYDPLPLAQYQKYRANVGVCVVTLFESGKLLIQGDNCEAVSRRILESVSIKDETIVGIDETGRGENFGPLVVCAVKGKSSKLREVRDSKKTGNITAAKKKVDLNADQTVCLEYPSQTIDDLRQSGVNMNQIEAKAIDLLVDFFRRSGFDGKIVIDGNPLPVESKNIFFIPKADDSEPCVAAASVVARFVRDASKDKAIRKTWAKRKE